MLQHMNDEESIEELIRKRQPLLTVRGHHLNVRQLLQPDLHELVANCLLLGRQRWEGLRPCCHTP